MTESDTSKTRGRRRSGTWWAKLILSFGGLLAGLVMAELLLRLMGVSYPLPYYPDPHVGSRLTPGFAGWFTKEGCALVRVNSAGFRDREHDVQKPPGTVRVAVLGDSFAEACQVPLEQTFWSVLQEELARQPTFGERQVEVLNFGISGHGTAQQLQMLRHHVWPYDPDLIVLAFYAGNDVRNNSRRLEPDEVRPFFFQDNDTLLLDDRFLAHDTYLKAQSRWVRAKVWFINRSRLLQCVQQWRNRPPGPARKADDPLHGVETLDVFREPRDPDWQGAWQLTERLIEEVDREAQARGVPFVLVAIPQAIQVHPEPSRRQAFCTAAEIPDTDYADRRLAEMGVRLGFPVVTLADEMREHGENQQAYLYGFPNTTLGEGHWNAAGHRFAAARIARAIDRALTGLDAVEDAEQ